MHTFLYLLQHKYLLKYWVYKLRNTRCFQQIIVLPVLLLLRNLLYEMPVLLLFVALLNLALLFFAALLKVPVQPVHFHKSLLFIIHIAFYHFLTTGFVLYFLQYKERQSFYNLHYQDDLKHKRIYRPRKIQ